MLELKIHGLLCHIKTKDKKYFTYFDHVFVPHLKKKKTVLKTLGQKVNNDTWSVGYGIIPWLKKHKPEIPIKITEFNSVKNWKPLDLNFIKTWKLRKVQFQMVKSLEKQVVGNVVSVMASGKTQAILAVAYLITKQGGNVIVLVPSVKTKENMLKVADKELGLTNVHSYDHIRHEVVNNQLNCEGQIVVALDKSLLNDANSGDYKFFESIIALLTDESHNWSRNGWNELLEHLPNLNRCHGFSATSISEKEETHNTLENWNYRSLAALAACGPVTFRTTVEDVKELIDIPKLINFHFKWKREDCEELVERNENTGEEENINDWSILASALCNNNYRNKDIADIVLVLESLNRRTLTVINDITRIKTLLTRIGSPTAIGWLGDNVAFDHLGRPIGVKGLIEKIEAGEYLTVFTTNHIEEGFSLPCLNTMLMVEGKASVGTVQRSGRIIRQSDTKPVIINFHDNFGLYNHHSKIRSKLLSNYYNEKFVDTHNLQELNATLLNV